MGGEHSAFRSLVPGSAAALFAASMAARSFASTSSSPQASEEPVSDEEEINVNDESDSEDGKAPLQLTKN